ncbi:hypothetical protein CEXT_126181 [Caerostris extrusa]|uniref:Uncharacterized protein n=1 Tax=Caerostris extrusa TaxID=172846 RepID=A0AAV4XGD0_CAEEX|nr:hypothetical protein CEXT_126181 [Caerostris extrusa]
MYYYSSSQIAALLIRVPPAKHLPKVPESGVAEEKTIMIPPNASDPLSVGRHLSADERWGSGNSLIAGQMSAPQNTPEEGANKGVMKRKQSPAFESPQAANAPRHPSDPLLLSADDR